MSRTLRAFYAFDGISLRRYLGRMFVLLPLLIVAVLSFMNLFLHDAGSLFYSAMAVSTITPFVILAGAAQRIFDGALTGGKYFRSMVHVRKQFVREFRFQWLLGWMNVVWCIVMYYLASKLLFHAENGVTFDRMIFTAALMTVVTSCMPFCLLFRPLYAELTVYIIMFTLLITPVIVFLKPYPLTVIVLSGIAAILAFTADSVWMHAAARNLAAGSEER
jgi:hypothetical protein